jgi:serine/threonine-protein kinase
MELLEGVTLAERIAQGPLHPREAYSICEKVGSALEVAHAHGIVHRDLKPANIMLSPDGEVKVMDFGLAMDLNAERSTMGARIGTPAYWSPEQARGERATERSDIYSMAVIFCELLGGKRPGWAEEPDLSNVTPIFHPIVLKCLAVNPAHRYASVAEARRDLDDAWATMERGGRRPYKRRFLVLAAAGGLALGVIATIAILLSAQ